MLTNHRTIPGDDLLTRKEMLRIGGLSQTVSMLLRFEVVKYPEVYHMDVGDLAGKIRNILEKHTHRSQYRGNGIAREHRNLNGDH